MEETPSSSSGWFAHAPATGRTYASSLRLSFDDDAPSGTGPGSSRPELADLRRLARRGVRRFVAAARADERPSVAGALAAHLGPTGTDDDVVEQTWPPYEHVNVQIALDAWLAGRDVELLGLTNTRHRSFGLGDLRDAHGSGDAYGVGLGPVARIAVPSGPGGRTEACVRVGLYLVTEGDTRTAILLRGPEPESGIDRVSLQVASTLPDRAAAVPREIAALALERNVFRGQVLSFGGEVFGPTPQFVTFHERPAVTADDLVLPAGTVDAVRRQVVGVARHRDRLRAAGQHLKRGLLLHGPPGVGKTHTVRYLVASSPGTTVVQLTGAALHLVAQACDMARALQPAMLVIEDVDLIAAERGLHDGDHPLLFQLLNEMDGLAEDADVVFVLTTNRADVLEPALAQRPGRVDQAVELRLPDADARRALVDLYRGDLDLDTSRIDDVVARTEGVTASFLKELLRRAALVAAEREDAPADGGRLAVRADDLDAALDDLLDTRNQMTRAVLGGPPAA